MFVPVGGEAVGWLMQPFEHSVVANPVYSESPSDVAENDVQLAVVLLNDATAGWLIKTAAAEVRGEGAAGEITFVEWWMGVCHRHVLVLQTMLSDKSRLCSYAYIVAPRETS